MCTECKDTGIRIEPRQEPVYDESLGTYCSCSKGGALRAIVERMNEAVGKGSG
jgi:hypothetical protein